VSILYLDFETEPIEDIPDGRYPRPVGMAYAVDDGTPVYLAWGHPTGNNCKPGNETMRLLTLRHHASMVVCHNIGFDVSVVAQHMGVGLAYLVWHDTQVMAFHNDPHAFQLGLKPLAEKYLDMPPDEQDDVRAWLREHKIIRSNQKEIGAFLHLAPGDLVGRYAVGDIVRTRGLFKLWRGRYEHYEGYLRDMKATRVGLKMTARGVLLDRQTLDRDLNRAEDAYAAANRRLGALLGLDTYDPNQRDAVATALETRLGIDLPLTATGRRQTNKDALDAALPDGEVKALMRYSGAIGYDLKNYLRPWQHAVERTGGLIHPTWSVTRSDSAGARTGRLSSSPNFQNLRGEEGTEVLVEWLRKCHPGDYWTPQIRGCVVAPARRIIVGRDWSQIELRITAHYEDGPMAANYRTYPTWDLHDWVRGRVKAMFNVDLIRRIAKNIGFGSIYGGGAGALAKQAKISTVQAAEFRTMYFEALPSLKELMDEVQSEARMRAITTLGGRAYKAEQPRFDREQGRWMEFYYKMLNYLIQGSAADLMKEAMIDADEYGAELILTVHDEPVTLCDDSPSAVEETLEMLRVAMEHNDLAGKLTVPIISDGYAVKRWSDADQAKKLYAGM